MTELLKDTMSERADALGPPYLDVLGMVREGNRRVARRRSTLLVAGAAAAVVAALAVPALRPDAPQRATDERSVAAAFSAHEPTYAIGSEVHIDGRTFDVGRPVRAFVQTTVGVVFTDKDGTVWASDGSRTDKVGRTDATYPRLEADGSRAAWVEHPAGGPPEFAALDQSTGEVEHATYDTTGDAGPTEYSDALFAVDGSDIYFRDSRGIVRWNVVSGDQTSLGRPLGLEIDDVSLGMIAQDVEAEDGTGSYAFGPGFGDTPSDFYHTLALSPDGTLALGESAPDTPALADTANGRVSPLDVPGYGFFAGYGWVDDDTFVGIGVDEPSDSTPVDLLECEVGGACTVTGAGIGSLEGGLVLPFGESMD